MKIKMLEIRAYSYHKVVHECDDNGVCADCEREFSLKLKENDLLDVWGTKEDVWWTCKEYVNKAF